MKKFLSVIICLFLILSVLPLSAGAQSSTTLRFDENGKFKIVIFADCQDDAVPDQRMLNLMSFALDREKPDLVIFTGDNIVTGSSALFRMGAEALLEPLVSRGVPYAYTYGNHDDEDGVSKETQYDIYNSIGDCLTYDAAPSITGFGNCNLPIYSSADNSMAFNLWLIDSNTYASGGYDNVHQDQIDWYLSQSQAIEQQEGHKVNSLLFQHIIVPEGYELLKESASGSKSYNGKTYELSLNDKASGYLGEFPCPPATNSGQFSAVVNRGDVLGMFFGHDHSNSFTGTVNGVDLVAVPGMTFSSYGDSNARGYGVIELDESNTASYDYNTVKYVEYESGIIGGTELTPDNNLYSYNTGTQFISDIFVASNSDSAAAQSAVSSAGYQLIGYDLNAGAGGDYVYCGVRYTDNYNDALKNILFYSSSAAAGSDSAKVSYGSSDITYTRLSGTDLNSGSGGDYIYFYGTKDSVAGPALTGISFAGSVQNTATCAGSLVFPAIPAELNKNTTKHKSDIYCHKAAVSTVLDTSPLAAAETTALEIDRAIYTENGLAEIDAAVAAVTALKTELSGISGTTRTQADIDNTAAAVSAAAAAAEKRSFSVRFYGRSGNLIVTQTVSYGEDAAAPSVPATESDDYNNYTFSGWKGSYTNITADADVYAQYTAAHYHTPETVSGKAPTCTETGLSDFEACATCGITLSEQTQLPATGHAWGEWLTITAATCSAAGKEKRICAYDSTHIEIRATQTAAHTPGTPAQENVVETSCSAEGSYDLVTRCAVCNAVISSEHKTVEKLAHTTKIIPGKAETCTENGLTIGLECSVCGAIIATQKEIPATGHDWSEWTVTAAPSCTSNGSEKRVCANDSSHVETKAITAAGHTEATREENRVNSTCSAEGSYNLVTYCTVCNTVISSEAKTIEKAAHTPEAVPGKAATCTEAGLTDGVICSVCGEILTAQTVIAAKGHTEQTITGKAASCTEAGLTDGVKCSVCGEILTAQTVIAATGHDYYISSSTPATCVQEGKTVSICRNNPAHSFTETTPKTGHSDGDGDGICDYCGTDIQADIEKNCSHLCHSQSRFMQFIWKIVNFFCKLFKINQTCACGAQHW